MNYNILDLLLSKIERLCDYFRFGAVSSLFGRVRASRKYKPPKNTSFFPWVVSTHQRMLVLSSCDTDNDYRAIEEMRYDPHPHMDYCLGTSHDWLIYALQPPNPPYQFYQEYAPLAIVLRNPFSGEKIQLPTRTLRYDHLNDPYHKVILSSSPSEDGVCVAVWLDRERNRAFNVLSCCRIGLDEKWIDTHTNRWGEDIYMYNDIQDILFHGEMLYVITGGHLLHFRINSTNPGRPCLTPGNIICLPRVEKGLEIFKSYIVVLNEDLYHVKLCSRGWGLQYWENKEFLIHKYERNCQTKEYDIDKWICPSSLEGGAMFIGRNQCIVVPASALVTNNCILKNCIYFFFKDDIYRGFSYELDEEDGYVTLTDMDLLPHNPHEEPVWFDPGTLRT